MQQRIIDPPKKQWDLLPTPFTPGEREVFELFDAKLPSEWEMYIQPHLNGLRPDLVLLNPYAGIAVYEIKDWNLNSIQCSIQSDRTTQNPINKIKLYEEELLELYCPRLNDSFGRAAIQVITAGLIFTRVPQAQVESLLAPYRDHRHSGMNKHPKYYPIVGLESLVDGSLDTLFPVWKQTWGQQNPSYIMSEDAAEDLRGWVKEPAFSQEQREPFQMHAIQHEIATTRTATGYRRVKGPAGSGKSVALAARAAKLASEGKQVLVCTFNITLMRYLRDLVARHIRYPATQHVTSSRIIRNRIEFRHFHGWFKQVCINSGYEENYSQLWKEFQQADVKGVGQNTTDNDLRMVELVQRIYNDPQISETLQIYDAILVDEGQDYSPIWWQTLRKALVTEDEEMLLVADKTQNIYGTAAAWTEEAMRGAGFSGPWRELKTSYRLPSKIIPILQKFADEFLTDEDIDIPVDNQTELGDVELRWVHISSRVPIVDICFEEVCQQMQRLRDDTANPDVIFLAQNNDIGCAFVEKCEQKNIHVLHTFGQDDEDDASGEYGRDFRKHEDSRRKKLAFYQGVAKVKATTLHSFKGLGSKTSSPIYPEYCEFQRSRLTLHSSYSSEASHKR